LIEECPCENAAQLRKKEGEHIRLNHDMCVNIQIPGRPRQELCKAYHEAHKEEHNDYNKAYYKAHKEQRKAYYKANRERATQQQRERRAKAKATKADAP
jgi:hypothetical protein